MRWVIAAVRVWRPGVARPVTAIAFLGGDLAGVPTTLLGNPQLLLLDEPSEGLAPIVVATLRVQIARLKGEGLTILLCEQNLSFARALADRVYIIDKGVLRFAGTFQELEANPEVKRAPRAAFKEAAETRTALAAGDRCQPWRCNT